MNLLRAILVAGVLMLATSEPTLARQPSPEDSIEASMSMLEFSATTLKVGVCPTCTPLLLNIDANTRFISGGEEVSFATFSQLMRESEKAAVAVVFHKTTKAALRVVTSARIAR